MSRCTAYLGLCISALIFISGCHGRHYNREYHPSRVTLPNYEIVVAVPDPSGEFHNLHMSVSAELAAAPGDDSDLLSGRTSGASPAILRWIMGGSSWYRSQVATAVIDVVLAAPPTDAASLLAAKSRVETQVARVLATAFEDEFAAPVQISARVVRLYFTGTRVAIDDPPSTALRKSVGC